MYALDTQKIGRKIMTARKDHNMTQLALADKLGVSYQAISNWERGQSAPDIDKLPDLAAALDISLNDLFDMPDAENKVVAIRQESAPVDAQTLTEFAPLIKPDTLNKKAADAGEFSVSDVKAIAPFISEETLVHLMREHEDDANFTALVLATAPFLNKDYLNAQVDALLAAQTEVDAKTLRHLMPFIDREKVDALLVRRISSSDVDAISDAELTAYLPFASRKTLGAVVSEREHDLNFVLKAAPFLGKDRVDELFKKAAKKETVRMHDLARLAPFVSKETLKKVVVDLINDADQQISLKDLMPILPFLHDADILALLKK